MKAFGLVEVIIAVAIVSISLFALSNAANLAFFAVHENARETRAAFLLEEGVEAVKILRDFGWTAYLAPTVPGATYYPLFSDGWSLETTNPGLIDGVFTLTIIFDEVYRRDSDDDIVDISSLDPKALDPETKKVTVSITWQSSNGNIVKTRSVTTYLTNIFQN